MSATKLDHRVWDTQHFGYPVAAISNPDIKPEELECTLRAAQKQGYQLVYWASNREYANDTPWLREYQGMLVDRKTTFAKPLRRAPASQLDENYQFVEWDAAKFSPELIELGIAAGLWSRFALDPRIAPEKFRSLYEIWMIRSLARELCDTVLVIQAQGSADPLGFVSLTLNKGIGQIELIAVHEDKRGQGLGRKLIAAADRWMYEHGAHSAQVVTQLQNTAACRLYEQAGYKIESIEYFYHFWLPTRIQALRA